MRSVSVTAPSLTGTLRSARTRTRFAFTSKSSSVRNAATIGPSQRVEIGPEIYGQTPPATSMEPGAECRVCAGAKRGLSMRLGRILAALAALGLAVPAHAEDGTEKGTLSILFENDIF